MHTFGPFTYKCCKKCMAYLLTIFCFRSMADGNCQFSSASFSLYHWWEVTHWYMNLVMAAVELYLNATLYAQHPSCIEISLWKLFSSYIPQCLNLHTDRVFEIPKQVPWVAAFIEVLVQKEALAWPYVRMGYLHYFDVFSHYHQF